MAFNSLTSLSTALAGRYRVERELGAGGMATVYLAQDLRHDRKVALKVLRPELSAVVGADRFLQEIKLTANLQHPHILPLHDSGQVSLGDPERGEGPTVVYYVMPYVEGESLRARLLREKQLSIDEALEITKAVASALDYAHRKGIIHRDIKPENILLHDGQAVVADFGIALAVSHAGGHRMTETGLSIGTPQYMSPEQAMGERELTARSDVYALGAVLYEMLVGEPPFTGPTAQAIVAKVITEKAPKISAYRDTVPPSVDAAVRRSLAKLPADRFTTAHEFAHALTSAHPVRLVGEDAPAAAQPTREATPVVRREGWLGRWPAMLPWALCAALALAVFALAMRRLSPALPSEAPTGRFVIPLPADARHPDDVSVTAISPDGSRLYLGLSRHDTLRLYERRLDSLELQPLLGTEGINQLTVSPDGRWLTFTAGGHQKRMPASGGPVTDLTPGQWSGAITSNGGLYFTKAYNGGLWYLAPGTTRPTVLTTPDTARKELGHWSPRLLPGERALLFTNYSLPLAQARIESIDLASKKRKVLVDGAVDARYSGGFLFFARVDVIYAAPFDAQRLEVTGQAVPVLQGVAGQLSNGVADYDVSPNGTLAYMPATDGLARRTLVWVDRSGAERAALSEARDYHFPRLSPDARRVAIGIAAGGGIRNIWVYEFERGLMQRITSHQASSLAPVWSPDGSWLYWTRESPVFDLYRRPSNASAPEELLLTSGADKRPSDVTADGKRLIFSTYPQPSASIDVLSLDARKADPLLHNEGVVLNMAVLSPDNKWLAFQSNESGRTEVYLCSYPDVQRVRRQVSTGGGEQPAWSRHGRELVYRAGSRMMAASVDPVSGQTGRPSILFSGNYTNYEGLGVDVRWYDVTPDGERFLMVKPSPDAVPQRIVVVLNWLAEVRTRVGQ